MLIYHWDIVLINIQIRCNLNDQKNISGTILWCCQVVMDLFVLMYIGCQRILPMHFQCMDWKNKKSIKPFYNYWRCERQINNTKWAAVEELQQFINCHSLCVMKTESFCSVFVELLSFHSLAHSFYSKWSRELLHDDRRWRWRDDGFIWLEDLPKILLLFFSILEHFVLPSKLGYEREQRTARLRTNACTHTRSLTTLFKSSILSNSFSFFFIFFHTHLGLFISR